jgi:hypothetical protein
MHRLSKHFERVQIDSAEEYLSGCDVRVFAWCHPMTLVAPDFHLPTLAAEAIKEKLPGMVIHAVFFVPTLDFHHKAIVYYRPPGAGS